MSIISKAAKFFAQVTILIDELSELRKDILLLNHTLLETNRDIETSLQAVRDALTSFVR
jgi:hypothetical protein